MYDCKQINYNDVKHYLGMDKNASIDNVLFDSVKKELFEIASPRNVWVESDVVVKDGFYFIPNLDLHLQSHNLNAQFVEVQKILTLAVTLGIMVDKKIDFYSRCNVSRGMILDAMSNVYIENYMDELEYKLREQYFDYHFTMRYSCGYGDLGLQLQPKLIKALQADKLIGITVMENNFMLPMKSITGFLGLSKIPQQQDKSPCSICSLQGKCLKKCRKAMQYYSKNANEVQNVK